jgi:hypothetical protein
VTAQSDEDHDERGDGADRNERRNDALQQLSAGWCRSAMTPDRRLAGLLARAVERIALTHI